MTQVSSWDAWLRRMSGRYRTLGGGIKKLFPGFCFRGTVAESAHLRTGTVIGFISRPGEVHEHLQMLLYGANSL